MVDIEEITIKYLADKLSMPVYAEVPKERPSRFVSVERVGGGTELFRDLPQLAIQCWGQTRFDASLLAQEVVNTVSDMIEVEQVMKVEVESLYNFPDPDSRQSRYQITASVVTA